MQVCISYYSSGSFSCCRALSLAQPDRITAPIDARRTVVLKGNVHPMAQPRFDQGPVEPAFRLSYITLMLKKTDAQQAALEQLLQAAARSGIAELPRLAHARAVCGSLWPEPERPGQDLRLVAVRRLHRGIRGARAQLAGVQRHGRASAGNVPYRNPSLSRGRRNRTSPRRRSPPFRRRWSRLWRVSWGSTTSIRNRPGIRCRPIRTALERTPWPRTIWPPFTTSPSCTRRVIDGTGQSIVVVGQSAIDPTDIQGFRSKYNLPALNLQTIPYSRDPGTDATP